MPKKMGENSKAVEAKARKDQVQKEKQAAKEKDEEDKLWQDDDKHVLRKQERKVRMVLLPGCLFGSVIPCLIGWLISVVKLTLNAFVPLIDWWRPLNWNHFSYH